MKKVVQKISFIGLGNMGYPMARRLVQAGYTVNGFDPALQIQEVIQDKQGLFLHNSVSGAVDNSDLTILMLPNGAIVKDVLTTIFAIANPPLTVVDCSTIDIADAREAHAMAEEEGIGFLDSPVSGGTKGAANGTLTAMVGGDADLLNTLKPHLNPLFGSFVHCGGPGNGQAAKLCNNQLLATTMIGAAESFTLGEKLGLDPDTLFQVMSTSTGSCWSVNQYCPVPGVGPSSPADNEYQPGFSAAMMLKDLNLSQLAAEAVNQSTPLGYLAKTLYENYVNAGASEKDFSGIIQHIKALD